MQTAIQISQRAFLARINQMQARRVAVDTRYDVRDDKTRLVIIYDDGSERVFEGLRAA